MADLLALSQRVIDSGTVDGPVNRTTGELSEVADGLAMVESFSHTVAWDSGEGLVCFDASHLNTGAPIVAELSRWRPGRIHTLVYTHGHIDHVGGSGAFVAHNKENGHAPCGSSATRTCRGASTATGRRTSGTGSSTRASSAASATTWG